MVIPLSVEITTKLQLQLSTFPSLWTSPTKAWNSLIKRGVIISLRSPLKPFSNFLIATLHPSPRYETCPNV